MIMPAENHSNDLAGRMATQTPKIAIAIPCFNEAISISEVITGFCKKLPDAQIYVYDNNSTDDTARLAAEAGAIVCLEEKQGKGNVIRRIFSDIETDVLVIVDGDSTYDPEAAPMLVKCLIEKQLDMVIATRLESEGKSAFRSGHRFGNKLLTNSVNKLFKADLTDILSGYRVLSRRFIKSFPALSTGFETETELTIHALELRLPIKEIETHYRERPQGSHSKLKTYRDGLRILATILKLVREAKPVFFYGFMAGLLAISSVCLAWPLLIVYIETGLVPRIPTALLSMGLMLLAFLSATCGLILENVSRGRWEQKRMAYLAYPAPTWK